MYDVKKEHAHHPFFFSLRSSVRAMMSSSVRAALSALPLSRERRLSGKTPVSSGSGTKRRRRGNAIAMIPSKCEDDDGSKTNPEERAPTLARGKTRRRDVLLVATTTAASIVEISSLGCVFPPVASASVGSSPAVTNTVFFEFAIDGQRIGRVVVGVYGDTSVTAQRFLTLTKGIRGLSYRRKPIIGIEKNEDDTKANEETPLWITSAPIAKFEAPGTGDAIDDVPGGLTNEEVVKDVGKIKHDRANLVSVQVREDPRMPKPEPKSKLVSNRGKFERVYEPLPPEPNGTSFSITYAPSADLDVTNVVVGEVLSGFDVLAKIGALPTVPDNSNSPFFQVAKSIGDKRALVSEKGFGKPFAKVIITQNGEFASKKEEEGEKDEGREEQGSQ